MPVVVIGLNHRTAPLELLERTTVAPDALAKALTHVC
jgi:glutamyl-tRNA reductase